MMFHIQGGGFGFVSSKEFLESRGQLIPKLLLIVRRGLRRGRHVVQNLPWGRKHVQHIKRRRVLLCATDCLLHDER